MSRAELCGIATMAVVAGLITLPAATTVAAPARATSGAGVGVTDTQPPARGGCGGC
jgi:hypothetical protein